MMGSYTKIQSQMPARTNWINSRRRAMLLTCAFMVSCLGCGYPEVSPKAYEISKGLYTVCNLKRQSDLDQVSDVISKAASASELTKSEAGWLMGIVEQARAGQWEAAGLEARSILQDQADL